MTPYALMVKLGSYPKGTCRNTFISRTRCAQRQLFRPATLDGVVGISNSFLAQCPQKPATSAPPSCLNHYRIKNLPLCRRAVCFAASGGYAEGTWRDDCCNYAATGGSLPVSDQQGHQLPRNTVRTNGPLDRSCDERTSSANAFCNANGGSGSPTLMTPSKCPTSAGHPWRGAWIARLSGGMGLSATCRIVSSRSASVMTLLLEKTL